MLDEECRFPKSSDASFLEKITAQHKDTKNFERAKTARTSFVVKHYAGDVSYEVKDFLEKNRDTMREDMLSILLGSKVELVKTIFTSAAAPGEDLVSNLLSVAPVYAHWTSVQKRATVGSAFRQQLQQLVQMLDGTNPFYVCVGFGADEKTTVGSLSASLRLQSGPSHALSPQVRCIKPNMAQQPESFDPEQVLAQLRYAGMLETVRVRRSGYPVRVPHEDFAKRFGLLLTGPQQKQPPPPARVLCERILQSIKPPANMGAGTHWQVGVSKVFLRDYMGAALEDLRNARLVKQVIAIQSWWRMIVLRLFYLHARGAAICIQSNLRRFLLRKAFRRLREAVLTGQAFMRMLQVRKSFAIKVLSLAPICSLFLSPNFVL